METLAATADKPTSMAAIATKPEEVKSNTVGSSSSYNNSSSTVKKTTIPQHGGPSADVPIFLRKTYHMVDTCDPAICSWSEDGETFVVKDPDQFEQTIIPQFFKHSKFSSFVRQLNFYSFRKIKYCDTIRIDPKLEAETANYWRFRHEKFQRGKPELLSEIKRMNGSKTSGGIPTEKEKKKPDRVTDSLEEEPTVKSEVQTLKKRIEEMTKNIDVLTNMVQKVTLKQEAQPEPAVSDVHVGSKRKKIDFAQPPAIDDDDDNDQEIQPDIQLSEMELDEVMALAVPPPQPMTQEISTLSDNEFVDQLFTAFNDESDEFLNFETASLPPLKMQEDSTQSSASSQDHNSNRPDPDLMKRLGDALTLLPKDIQEMIINRLIAAITSTDFLDSAILKDPKKVVASSGKALPVPAIPVTNEAEVYPIQTQDFPLAAATLAALLHHYASMQQQQQGKKQPQNMQKLLPVIPVHA